MALELSDEILISASRDRVYAALQDAAILQQCIPGCEELIQHSPTDLEAKVVLKIGPVKARSGGKVTLDTAGAPAGFTLRGEGSGGVAGFAKGGAAVTLEDLGTDTMLRYTASADVGGQIAQPGSRLIFGTARTLAGNFFATFAEVVKVQEAGAD